METILLAIKILIATGFFFSFGFTISKIILISTFFQNQPALEAAQ